MSDSGLTVGFDKLVATASQLLPITCDSSEERPVMDISLYLDQELYFKLLQDDGCAMSDKEKEEQTSLQLLKPKKNVSRRMNIFFKGRFYSLIYKLGKEIFLGNKLFTRK